MPKNPAASSGRYDAVAQKWIYWMNELNKDHNELVGKKCANLGEMTNLGMKVPPGFAISVDGFQRYMEETGLGESIKKLFEAYGESLTKNVAKQMEVSRIAREMVKATPMPQSMADEVRANYEELCRQCGNPEVPVAVRSSGAVSMPGQMETYLNVQGADSVIKHVVEVWESTLGTRAIAFRLERGLPVDRAPIGVAVIKMVRAKSAGVILTVIPTTGDQEHAIIEGNWGLGESVVSGDITPDNFIVHKETALIEKQIALKTRQVIGNGKGTVKVDVPEELREIPCLNDEEIIELVRVARDVEGHFGCPQDMEWVVDSDMQFPENVFWVQARPAKFTPKAPDADVDYLVDKISQLFSM